METNKNQYFNGKLWVESVLRKYINGTDIKSACERLLQQNTNDSKIRNILNNCITLFGNPDVKEKIEEMKSSGTFPNTTSLMKHIIAEFYPEIFGPDPHNIAEYILRNYLSGTDIHSVCHRLSQLLNNDSNPEHSTSNEECKKILQNCLALIENPKIQSEIESIKKSESIESVSELAKRIETEYYEEIFEKDKRNYDMPSHYKSNLIASQTLPNGVQRDVIEYRDLIKYSSTDVPDLDGNMLKIVKIGRLAYKAHMHSADFVDKYQIYTADGRFLCEIYTRLNLSELRSNEAYRRAVFKELLCKKNLQACLPSKYIGEIKANNKIFGENVQIGEQKDVFDGYANFSMFGYSKQYSFIFDYDSLAAVKLHIKEQNKPLGTNPQQGTPR